MTVEASFDYVAPEVAQIIDRVLAPAAGLVTPETLSAQFGVTTTSLRAIKLTILRVVPVEQFQAAASRFPQWSEDKQNAAYMGLADHVGQALLHHLNANSSATEPLVAMGQGAVSQCRLLAHGLSVTTDLAAQVARWPAVLFPPELADQPADEGFEHAYVTTANGLRQDITGFRKAGRGAELLCLMHVADRAGRMFSLVDQLADAVQTTEQLAKAMALRAVQAVGDAKLTRADGEIHQFGNHIVTIIEMARGLDRILAGNKIVEVDDILRRVRGVAAPLVEATLRRFGDALRGVHDDDGLKKRPAGLLNITDPACLTALEASESLAKFTAKVRPFGATLGCSAVLKQSVGSACSDLQRYAEQAMGVLRSDALEHHDQAQSVLECVTTLLQHLGEDEDAQLWARRGAAAGF